MARACWQQEKQTIIFGRLLPSAAPLLSKRSSVTDHPGHGLHAHFAHSAHARTTPFHSTCRPHDVCSFRLCHTGANPGGAGFWQRLPALLYFVSSALRPRKRHGVRDSTSGSDGGRGGLRSAPYLVLRARIRGDMYCVRRNGIGCLSSSHRTRSSVSWGISTIKWSRI